MQEGSQQYHELEARLANAENLVNALRNLEIDAIVGEQHVAYVQLKEVADTIRISRELYRHIVKEAPIGIAEVDLKKNKLITSNTKLSEYTGYTRDELNSIPMRQLFTTESLPLLDKQVHDILTGHYAPSQMRYKLKRKDGSEFWALIQTKISYADHHPTTAIVTVTDITKEKELEHEELRLTSELHQEKELLNIIMENTHAHLAYLDDHFNFIRVNTAFAKRFGNGNPADFQGKNYFTYFHNHSDKQLFDNVLHTKQPALIKGKTISDHHGASYWNWAISPVIDKKNTVQGLVLSLMDVTDLKKSEHHIKELNWNLLRRTYDLQNVNKELESFSYSISHDLRAPLRRISGFSTALLEDCILDDQGKDYLQRIIKTARQMDELVDALLRLSRLTRAPMTLQTVNLTAIAQDIIHDYERAEPHRHITVTIQDGLTAEGDNNLLRTLLENLIGNAWKFTSKQPAAAISIGKDKETNDETVFYVKDNGIGFNMQYANKLFTPFQRLHKEGEYPGTGIGLGISNRIINRHNGKIWAQSSEGKGATFYFSLPKHPLKKE